MKNDRSVSDISDLGANRYPHLKMTNEAFARVLATRRIEDDGADYYGAFLTKTAVRIMIDLINRVFKLRLCDLDIDGSWPAPCTQFYRRRCLAPCVAKLCSADEYRRMVELARLFIANERKAFTSVVRRIMEECSNDLDFEKAAYFRDILLDIEKFWKQPRTDVWLDDTVDTYAVEDTAEGSAIFLITHRGRAVLGRKVFTVDREDYETSDEALYRIIESSYQFHLPREIRVTRDFHKRKELIEILSARFDRQAIIRVCGPSKTGVNARRGLHLGRDEHELDKVKPIATPEIMASKLRQIFGTGRLVERVEAFDVAHISATGFVAAWSVWEKGRYLSADYGFVISGEESELSVLADSVERRLNDPVGRLPDLIVLDGGKSQLNAVLKKLGERDGLPAITAAVKPRARHSSIAAFLMSGRDPIDFNPESPAHTMLQLLRDEAHDLANRAHRDHREMMPFYEVAGVEKPIVVPLRFHAENGGADDLIPIETR
jgi:excinuclease ABC subunit C